MLNFNAVRRATDRARRSDGGVASRSLRQCAPEFAFEVRLTAVDEYDRLVAKGQRAMVVAKGLRYVKQEVNGVFLKKGYHKGPFLVLSYSIFLLMICFTL